MKVLQMLFIQNEDKQENSYNNNLFLPHFWHFDVKRVVLHHFYNNLFKL